jgi:hypothetical protein
VIHVTRRLFAVALLLAASLATAQTPRPVSPAGGVAAADRADRADAAEVMLSEGDTILVRGSSFSTPVRRDVPIRSGDRIRTGSDGRVQLRFSDGAMMSIQPDSDFRIDAYAFDAVRQRSFFVLMHGSLRAVSGSIGKRNRDEWRLKTPTATIGIRGTEFTVAETVCAPGGCAAGAAGGLTVAVIVGRVAVSNEAGSIEVPAGATLRVRDARTVPVLADTPAGRARSGGASMRPLDGPDAGTTRLPSPPSLESPPERRR